MSEQPRHLRVLERLPAPTAAPEGPPSSERRSVAFLHEWRAEKIRTSMALHPTSLARAATLPALRPVR